MRKLVLLSYQYPDRVKVAVNGTVYTYEASEFFCRRFVKAYECGGRFNVFNWFKHNAKLIGRETNEDKWKKGEGNGMLQERYTVRQAGLPLLRELPGVGKLRAASRQGVHA